MSQPRVVAVIVTWNRRELLAESLSAVADQTRPPDRLVVVDNASTDGTAELLTDRFPMLEVVRTARNIGGAGGFALGIRRALEIEPADAVWLLDDDTVPRAYRARTAAVRTIGLPGYDARCRGQQGRLDRRP